MKTELSIVAALLLLPMAAVALPVPPVILTEQGVRNLGLETVMIEQADFETTAFAFGRTAPMPQKRSVLSSRISGRVIESELQIGAFVTKGQQLLRLESRQPGNPPPAIWLEAPADGTIISVNTSLGAPVEPTDRLAEIADLRTIYLIATMPQALAGRITQGTQARVRFPLRPDKSYTATLLKFAACPCPDPVCALGQDTSTQSGGEQLADINTAGVVFTLENPDNQLRPGMTAECTIIMEKRSGVLSVPREAVQGGASDRHVYVKHMTIPHAFDRVSVQTGLANKERIEILDGLFPGDEVVTKGAYSLGYAGAGGGPSLREALDIAHGHEHNEDGSEKTSEAVAGNDHDHDHEAAHADHGFTLLELILMGVTTLLAVCWMLMWRSRQPLDADTTQPH